MQEKDIYMLERTKDSTSSIIGFYNTEQRALDAIRRIIDTVIDDCVAKSKAEKSEDHTGIYVCEGFLIARNRVEVDPDVTFDKIEDAAEFPPFHVDENDQFVGVDPAEPPHDPAEPLSLYGEDEVPLG